MKMRILATMILLAIGSGRVCALDPGHDPNQVRYSLVAMGTATILSIRPADTNQVLAEVPAQLRITAGVGAPGPIEDPNVVWREATGRAKADACGYASVLGDPNGMRVGDSIIAFSAVSGSSQGDDRSLASASKRAWMYFESLNRKCAYQVALRLDWQYRVNPDVGELVLIIDQMPGPAGLLVLVPDAGTPNWGWGLGSSPSPFGEEMSTR